VAVTYPLSLPTNRTFAQISIRAKNVVAVSRSPFTLQTQVLKYSGEMWEASVRLPVMKRDEASQWIAFLLSLKGRFGTFYLNDPDATLPLGAARSTPGTPVTDGGQIGETINVRGMPFSVTNYLLAGDYIQIGTGSNATLHKVLTNVSTNGSGRFTADVWPSLRRSVADGVPVTLTSPKGIFRLAENVTEYDVAVASRYGMSFSCEEVL
jgi:hypothetical protein